MTVPFAHAAHLLEIPIYGGPVILLIAWFKLGDWRNGAENAARSGLGGSRAGRRLPFAMPESAHG